VRGLPMFQRVAGDVEKIGEAGEVARETDPR
jgi:hypothetical protein